MTGAVDLVGKPGLGPKGSTGEPGRSWAARLSTATLERLVPRFTHAQQEIAKRVGFGFLLEISYGHKVERELVAWLCSLVDVEQRKMCAPSGRACSLCAEDVENIIGASRGSGRSVMQCTEGHISEVADNVARILCGQTKNRSATLSRARRVLDTIAGRAMQPGEEVAFVAALAMVGIGHFLAPRPSNRELHDEVLRALRDPWEIGKFDWAAFTLEALMAAVKDI